MVSTFAAGWLSALFSAGSAGAATAWYLTSFRRSWASSRHSLGLARWQPRGGGPGSWWAGRRGARARSVLHTSKTGADSAEIYAAKGQEPTSWSMGRAVWVEGKTLPNWVAKTGSSCAKQGWKTSALGGVQGFTGRGPGAPDGAFILALLCAGG